MKKIKISNIIKAGILILLLTSVILVSTGVSACEAEFDKKSNIEDLEVIGSLYSSEGDLIKAFFDYMEWATNGQYRLD